MLAHTYTYRGKTINVYKASVADIENKVQDQNYLEYVDKGVTYRIYVRGFSVNDQLYTLSVEYFLKKFIDTVDSEGNPTEENIHEGRAITKSVTDKYETFYKNSVDGMQGDFIRAAQFNSITEEKNYLTGEYFIGEFAYPANPLNNYTWMQPITYDLATTETGVTVTVVDTKAEYNLEYSLDGGTTYADLVATEIPLAAGSYEIIVRAKEELYPFPTSFSIIDPIVE